MSRAVENTPSRNYTVDFLRGIAMLCVMLAHCAPPALLLQLRNFDVPLLVVVSGITYSLFSSSKISSVRTFLVNRLVRLVVPAWIFLTLFFLIFAVVDKLSGNPYRFSLQTMLTTYFFYSGIGYVWVLRVFAVIAVLTPFLLYFRDKVRQDILYYGLLIVFYLGYEASFLLTEHFVHSAGFLKFLETAVFVIPSYAVLYAYGLRMPNMKISVIWIVMIFAAIICTGMACYFYMQTGQWMPTQNAKYPPRLYYLSYAIVCINALYLLAKSHELRGFARKAFTWISENSLWLYLWHILALFTWDDVARGGIQECWAAKFVFIFFMASAITALQKMFINRILVRLNGRPKTWLRLSLG